jgi:hypothetical protein
VNGDVSFPGTGNERASTPPPREEEVFTYLVTGLIVLIVVIALLGLMVVHHETAPGERPTMTVMRRGNVIVRKVMAGDPCPCGGTVAETGTVSDRLGPILGCTGCRRRWAMDGRRIVTTRRVPAAAATSTPATADGPADDLPETAES